MPGEALAALITAAGLVLVSLLGILLELVRSRKQSNTRLDVTIENQVKLNSSLDKLNTTLTDIDKRLVAVETTVSFFHPTPVERRDNACTVFQPAWQYRHGRTGCHSGFQPAYCQHHHCLW